LPAVTPDLIMPGIGGLRCLEEIVRINPKAKIILASGYPSNGLTLDEKGKAAKAFISKPYDAKDILRAIRRALDHNDA
jgi:two-component system, cell cycle sensor histidine kinase and response regulator CckA